MRYNVIATGSSGNAVVINDDILIDCGVPFKSLAPYAKDIKWVFLTHEHGDHFKAPTVRRLHEERPAIRFGCCEWMVSHLYAAKVPARCIDVFEPDRAYNYGRFAVSPVPLFHSVPNCGWRINDDGERLFYATDTGTLDGIEARDYDLYLVEANHTREELEARIEAKRAAGEYAYEIAAAANHLSREQAEDWIYQNIGQKGVYAFLHQHRGVDKC